MTRHSFEVSEKNTNILPSTKKHGKSVILRDFSFDSLKARTRRNVTFFFSFVIFISEPTWWSSQQQQSNDWNLNFKEKNDTYFLGSLWSYGAPFVKKIYRRDLYQKGAKSVRFSYIGADLAKSEQNLLCRSRFSCITADLAISEHA